MRSPYSKFPWLRKFARDETGSYSVEFVIWFPMFLFLFIIMFGFSVGMIRQTMILNEMNRVARAYALGAIATTNEAKVQIDDFITSRARLDYSSENSTVILIDQNDIVQVNVAIPMLAQLPVLGFADRFEAIRQSNISMSAYYHVENH